MVEYIVMTMALVALIVNMLLMFAVFAINKPNAKDVNYYFVMNMFMLNGFMAGVVVYGIFTAV